MKRENKSVWAARVGGVVGGVLLMALAACGGEDEAAPTPATPRPSLPIDNGSGGGTPTVPDPGASSPGNGTRTWRAVQTLPSGTAPMKEPALDWAGSTAMSTKTSPAGTISYGTFGAGGVWTPAASLVGAAAATGAVPSNTAARGDIFFATVILAGDATTPNWFLQAAATGSGQTFGTTSFGSVASTTQPRTKIHIDADGGATVFWVSVNTSSLGSSNLYSRRRAPGGTWGQTEPIASAEYLLGVDVLSAPDGSATVIYGRSSSTANVKDEVWGLAVDTHGTFGTRTRLDNPAQGNANAYMLRGGVSPAGTLVMWPVEQTGGGECLAGRPILNGSWRSQSCINGISVLDGVGAFGTASKVGGLVGAWWTTSTSELRTSTMTDAGTWAVDTLPTSPLFQSVYGAQMVGCPSGAGAMVWNRMDGSVHASRRNVQGVWEAPTLLVAGATGRTNAFEQVRADDACNLTFAWITGPTGTYDVVTRAWKAGAAAPDAAIVQATGVKVQSFTGGGWRGMVSLTVEPAGPAVLLWQETTDAVASWRRYE